MNEPTFETTLFPGWRLLSAVRWYPVSGAAVWRAVILVPARPESRRPGKGCPAVLAGRANLLPASLDDGDVGRLRVDLTKAIRGHGDLEHHGECLGVPGA